MKIKSTLIIAEAGVNHNGDMGIAKRLIYEAAHAGADLVKFQTFNAARLVTRTAPKAGYQNRTTDVTESQKKMLEPLELTREMHIQLREHCREAGIGFLSAGFDIPSIDLLDELGVERFKIPSGEITNLPYLRHIGRLGKPVILSSGVSTLAEVGCAIEILEKEGTSRKLITVLHCNTEYPTPMEDVNLHAMSSIQKKWDIAVGYSDHTLGIEVPIAAVALGATVIEKHFTLDRKLEGPDHGASLEPDELHAMVRAVRNIEKSLGDGVKKPSPSELQNKDVIRKSIVASRRIMKGEKFSEGNLTVKRPGTGISPMLWDRVVKRNALIEYEVDDLIEL